MKRQISLTSRVTILTPETLIFSIRVQKKSIFRPKKHSEKIYRAP